METFTKLFGSLLIFVYHCFDRVVIHGYLSGLSRPGQVVHFFHDVVGEPVIDKAVCRGVPMSIKDGLRGTPGIRVSRWNGPSQRCAKRNTFALHNSA
jgi:hypothetical protein